MFQNAKPFHQNLSNWNLQNVHSMYAMFAGAATFNGDISKWDVSNVTNMNGMFCAANSFQPESFWLECLGRQFYEGYFFEGY
jgi:surface protein